MQQPQVATVVYVGGQATVSAPPTYTVGKQPTAVKSYNGKQSMVIGITLIVSAVLCFIFNSVELGVGLDQYYYYGYVWGLVCHGFWTGSSCIVAGSLAIAASRNATQSRIVALNIFCIISASLACAQFIIGIIGASTSDDCYWSNSLYSCENVRNTLVAMESLLATLAVVEAAIAIWGSAICCKAYCCCTTVSPAYHYPTPIAANNGMPTMIVLNQPATVTSAAMGAQPAYYSHVQATQMTAPPPSHAFYNNQGYAYSSPCAPEPYPTAGPQKVTNDNPPEYTFNGTSS